MSSDTTIPQPSEPLPTPVPLAPHLPVWLVVDTSASMAPYTEALHGGVTAALDEAWGTLHALHTTRLGVLTAGEEAAVVLPLGAPVEPGTLGGFTAHGRADMAGLIGLLGVETERLTMANLERGRRTLRPWVLLLTDGRWDRADAAVAIDRLHAPPTQPTVCPLGVGAVDETTLVRVGTDLGFVIDTPDDLPGAMAELMRAILAQADSLQPDGVPSVPSLPGARPLEGW